MINKESELQNEIDNLRDNLLDILGDVLDAKHILSEHFGVKQDSFLIMFMDFINNYNHISRKDNPQ